MGRAGWRRPVLAVAVTALVASCNGTSGGTESGSRSSISTITAVSGTVASALTPTTAASPSTTPPSLVTTVPGSAAAITCAATVLAAGAVPLPAERCQPADAAGPLPAVVVLNGCGGYEPDAPITSLITRRLAAHGVVAVRLDYLAAKPAPPFTYCDAVTTAAAAPELLRALTAAIAALRADPTIDPGRVGAVGYSLGGLAAGFAQIGGGPFGPLESPGFGAMGFLSAVLPSQIADQAGTGTLPPLVIVHGAQDSVVPPIGAQALATAAELGGVDVQLDVVASQGHEWFGGNAEAAAERLATFLASRLVSIEPGRRG